MKPIELDEKAKGLAKQLLVTESELLSVLMEMKRLRSFAVLNYDGIFDYCERGLLLSRSQSYYFQKVAEKSEEIPELKTALSQGELSLSQARRIVSVITPENREEWIHKAKSLRQNDLEREVKEVNPNAHVKQSIKPLGKTLSQLSCPVEIETEKDISVLTDILSQKLKRAATLKEVIAWATRVCREKFDPEKKAQRAIRRKPFPRKLPQLGRHAILASVKHEVIRQKGYQCCHFSLDGRRCTQRRWLDFHHIIKVADGGLNTVENLILFCGSHHALQHERDPSLSPTAARGAGAYSQGLGRPSRGPSPEPTLRRPERLDRNRAGRLGAV